MSATLAEPAPARPVTGARPGPTRASRLGDRPVLAALAGMFVLFAALSWRKWGVPEIDAGAELTTADRVARGAVAYQDIRYFYGPLGLYSLALAFKVFGASFTTAFGFGLVQAAAIVGAFYALARRWLQPPSAGLTTAVLLAIGFSGTAFNFVLPHTNSATFGLLALLMMLLALSRERLLSAGVSFGLVGLTRPEFLAVAAGALVAFLLARWRTEGRSAALAAGWRLALPGVAIPAVVLGAFATRAGFSNLLTENLWPVKFTKVGLKTQSNWMPFTVASLFGLIARAVIYCGLLASLIASVEGWRRRRGAARLLAAWPLVAMLALIALGDGALRATGLFAPERSAIEHELGHLLLGMSWLPALALAVAALAAVRLVRREDSPLEGSWPVDFALIVAAAGLGLRAYNEFTTAGSYASYYAAPLVLLLGILHRRLADRRPEARAASLGALGLVAAGLAVYAFGGLYIHDTTTVHTPRGTFVPTAPAAAAIEAAVRQIDSASRPDEPILAAPADGGLYFMADRPPALYEVMLLPGLIDSRGEELAAVERLQHEHVPVAVIAARDFSRWGAPTFGVDYNPVLGAYLHRSSTATQQIGELANPEGGTNPSKGFTVLRLGNSAG